MILYKNYEPDNQEIVIPLSTGGELSLYMKDELLCFYGCNCEFETPFWSDDLKDLFFKIGNQVYGALQIVQWAELEHPKIIALEEEASNEEQEMVDYLSSPYLTGRI